MDPENQPICFVVRSPEFYRRVATQANDEALIRACLLLAADDIDRWRELGTEETGAAVPSA